MGSGEICGIYCRYLYIEYLWMQRIYIGYKPLIQVLCLLYLLQYFDLDSFKPQGAIHLWDSHDDLSKLKHATDIKLCHLNLESYFMIVQSYNILFHMRKNRWEQDIFCGIFICVNVWMVLFWCNYQCFQNKGSFSFPNRLNNIVSHYWFWHYLMVII